MDNTKSYSSFQSLHYYVAESELYVLFIGYTLNVKFIRISMISLQAMKISIPHLLPKLMLENKKLKCLVTFNCICGYHSPPHYLCYVVAIFLKLRINKHTILKQNKLRRYCHK
ncbi:hypothetical protein ACJX0J_020576, partial [Zea mays]